MQYSEEEPYGVPLTDTDGSIKVSPERVLRVDRMIADLGGTKHNTLVLSHSALRVRSHLPIAVVVHKWRKDCQFWDLPQPHTKIDNAQLVQLLANIRDIVQFVMSSHVPSVQDALRQAKESMRDIYIENSMCPSNRRLVVEMQPTFSQDEIEQSNNSKSTEFI